MSFETIQQKQQQQFISLLQQQYYKQNEYIDYVRINKGLLNNGLQVCYQNAVFQALFNIPAFQKFLRTYPIDNEDDDNIFYLIKNLYLSLNDIQTGGDETIQYCIQYHNNKIDELYNDFNEYFINIVNEFEVPKKDIEQYIQTSFIDNSIIRNKEKIDEKYITFVISLFSLNDLKEEKYIIENFKRNICGLLYCNLDFLIDDYDLISKNNKEKIINYINSIDINKHLQEMIEITIQDICKELYKIQQPKIQQLKTQQLKIQSKQHPKQQFKQQPKIQSKLQQKQLTQQQKIKILLQKDNIDYEMLNDYLTWSDVSIKDIITGLFNIETNEEYKDILVNFFNKIIPDRKNISDDIKKIEQKFYILYNEKKDELIRELSNIYNLSNEEIIERINNLFKTIEIRNILTPQQKIFKYFERRNIFPKYRQQDAQEFLLYILDQLSTQIITSNLLQTKIIEKINEYFMKHIKDKKDIINKKDLKYNTIIQKLPFMINNFNKINKLFSTFIINTNIEKSKKSIQQIKQSQDIYDIYNILLEQMFILYFTETDKDLDIYYLLNKSFEFRDEKDQRIIRRKTSIMILPNILIIQLARFQSNSELKLKNEIFIPEELDLKDYVDEDFKFINQKTKYILCSAVIHIGKDINSGHYITINRDMKDIKDIKDIKDLKKYYLYDDKNISLVNLYDNINYTDTNINNSAYLLFYVKI